MHVYGIRKHSYTINCQMTTGSRAGSSRATSRLLEIKLECWSDQEMDAGLMHPSNSYHSIFIDRQDRVYMI